MHWAVAGCIGCGGGHGTNTNMTQSMKLIMNRHKQTHKTK